MMIRRQTGCRACIAVVAGLLLGWSCSLRPAHPSEVYRFDTTCYLQGERLEAGRVQNLSAVAVLKDYVVTISQPRNTEEGFRFDVYSATGFAHLYSFARWQGEGRGYRGVTAPQHAGDNVLRVAHEPTGIVEHYDIQARDTVPCRVDSLYPQYIARPGKPEPDTLGGYGGRLTYVDVLNDSMLLYHAFGERGKDMVYMLNTRTRLLLDSMELQSEELRRYGNWYPGRQIDSRDGMLVAPFEHADTVVQVRWEANYTFAQEQVQQPSTWTADSVLRHYSQACIGSRHIYVGRVGRELEPQSIDPNYFRISIYMFDKEMKPVAELKLNKKVERFVVDEDKGMLYGWRESDLFGDKLYRFPLPVFD